MTMDIHDLQQVLSERAAGPPVDGPDIEALVRGGKTLRRRRRIVTSAATAVFIAAVTAVSVFAAGGFDTGSGPATIVPATTPTPQASTPSPSPSPSPSPTPTAIPSTTGPTPSTPSLPAAPTSAAPPPVDSAILVYGDCQSPTFEPSQLVLTCADHGFYFRDLHWTSWTAGSATAVGTEVYNDCTPSCAGGQIHSVVNASVTLTTPTTDAQGRQLWSQIEFSPQPPGYATGPYHGGPEPLPVRPT
jgi:hypothetical protein